MTWLRVAELAAQLGVSKRLIYAEIRRGRLRAARIGLGRNLLVAREHADQWLIQLSEPREVEASK